MKINKIDFGSIDDQKISLYELHNDRGVIVKITEYGATITAISTPDREGKVKEITCGFENLNGYLSEEYKANPPYFGGTIGRCASRIHKGKFTINGREYQLAANDRGNHLHGGMKGFDQKIWELQAYNESEHEVSIILGLSSPDMEEGYPGRVDVKISFTLNNFNELIIRYEAKTDKATPISLTNHSYFNLSGFKESIHNHKVMIHSEAFLQRDEKGVPQGKRMYLDGRPEDFREEKLFKEALDVMDAGLDHYYVFNNDFQLKKVASFEHSVTGRIMEVSTTEPGMLLYSGYFTSNFLKRENGDQYGKHRAFCCETHRYPNGPNLQDTPKSITYPKEGYKSTTVFKFYTK